MLTAKRRKQTKTVVERRLKQIRGPGRIANRDLEQPHRLAKRTALGCSRSNCRFCRKNKKEMDKRLNYEHSISE